MKGKMELLMHNKKTTEKEIPQEKEDQDDLTRDA